MILMFTQKKKKPLVHTHFPVKASSMFIENVILYYRKNILYKKFLKGPKPIEIFNEIWWVVFVTSHKRESRFKGVLNS